MRLLMILVSLCGAAISTAQAQPLDIFSKDTTELAPGVYTFGAFSARSLFVVTSEGVITTDPVNPKNAADMRAAIAEVTDQPVKYVIYSHQHWDHVLGGQIFKDEGATFLSHAKCIPHFMRHPNDDLVLPDTTVTGDSELTLGNKTLKLMYFGPNHGDCMLVMQVDGTDVLYINDLVTPYSVGLGFMPDMEALMQAVQDGIASGKRMEALYDTIELPEEFREMRGYETHLRRGAERIFHYYTMGW
jgi:glyoxylase-like metal-dependent hydrolase (beta-lactamase superfamily II)